MFTTVLNYRRKFYNSWMNWLSSKLLKETKIKLRDLLCNLPLTAKPNDDNDGRKNLLQIKSTLFEISSLRLRVQISSIIKGLFEFFKKVEKIVVSCSVFSSSPKLVKLGS